MKAINVLILLLLLLSSIHFLENQCLDMAKLLCNVGFYSRRLILTEFIGPKCARFGGGYRAISTQNLKQSNQCSAGRSTYRGSDQRSRNKNSRKVDLKCFVWAAPAFLKAFEKKEESETEEDLVKKWLDKLVPGLRLKYEKEDDSPEGQLVMAIKRAILCIHQEQYKKAEQMIHLALRMAQQMQHDNGITLCFDIMANLALEREQFEKADKLFVAVLQRLLETGVKQNDIKVFECKETTDFVSNNCYSFTFAGAAHKFETCTNCPTSITARKGRARLPVGTGGTGKRNEERQQQPRFI